MDQLPEDFDGVFRFTNFTDEEFKAKWNNVEYTFPPLSTTPLIISGETPEGVQNIRKKFARELAEKMWYASPEFKRMNKVPPGGTPALYTDKDIEPYIQRCLEPLQVRQATIERLKGEGEKRPYRRNAKGEPITKVLEDGDSLVGDGTPMQG